VVWRTFDRDPNVRLLELWEPYEFILGSTEVEGISTFGAIFTLFIDRFSFLVSRFWLVRVRSEVTRQIIATWKTQNYTWHLLYDLAGMRKIWRELDGGNIATPAAELAGMWQPM
jgi:hypothetical protein